LATVPGDELEYKDDSDGGPDSDEEYLKEMKSAAPSAAHDDGRAQHHGKHSSAQATKKSAAGFTVKIKGGDGDSDSDSEGKREEGGLDGAIRQLACSATDTLALTVDGQVFMWGTVSHGKGRRLFIKTSVCSLIATCTVWRCNAQGGEGCVCVCCERYVACAWRKLTVRGGESSSRGARARARVCVCVCVCA
jgi:hypothetical protein